MEGTGGAAFVGRSRELRLLDDAWAGDAGAFIPLYGRRRVGKSALLLEFLKGKVGLYHVGKVAPGELQLKEFLGAAAQALNAPHLARLEPRGWKDALEQVESAWTSKERLVLVLDEFQWMAQASPELPSVLQELWDRRWQGSKRIMLLLCGSFIGFMEREVLGHNSPLFGRRTAQIHLQPFGFPEAAEFHPHWSLEHRAHAYFICGGIPQYLRCFAPGKSVRHNVEAVILDELGALFHEPEFLLREELREVEKYHAVLWAIAQGNQTQKDIAAASGLAEKSLHYWLEQLISLGYVARRFALTGGPKNRRNVRYTLEDPLLRFWFRFVFPNRSAIARLGPQGAFGELIAPQLDAYFGQCFERLCREALPWIHAAEKVSANAEVGEYWDKSTQIDVVAVRDDQLIELGECKWGHRPSERALRDALAAKVIAFPNPKNATLQQRVFVRAKPAHLEGRWARWHDLEELFRLGQRAARARAAR